MLVIWGTSKGANSPGGPWNVLDAAGVLYTVSTTVLSAGGLSYVTVQTVLAADGTSYAPI